jgi:hypothetical protein
LFGPAVVILLFGRPLSSQAAAQKSTDHTSIANFIDIAEKAGLTAVNVFGGVDTKKYIIETTGTGVAIFDYDNDGWPDIFVVNGTTLEGFPPDQAPTNHLYHNNRDGTFTDVTAKAGLLATGWGQGVCTGDYDNDGWEDLYVTYFGKNRLYHNDHGVFSEVAEKAGVAGSGKAWGSGCAFVDYNRDGRLDLIVANYVDLNLSTTPVPGQGSSCMWKGVPVMCGPRGLPGAKNILYENRGDSNFADVTTKAHLGQTNGHYGMSVSTFDFDDDGWPDIYVACDSAPSILYHNNHDGTFTDVAVTAGLRSTKMAASRREWARPSPITTATAGWTFSRLTSPMTPRPYIATMVKDFFRMLPSLPDSACIRNTWAGARCFSTSTMMAGPTSSSPTGMSIRRWTSFI